MNDNKLTLTRHRNHGRDHWTIADQNYNMVGFTRAQAQQLCELLEHFLTAPECQQGTQITEIEGK